MQTYFHAKHACDHQVWWSDSHVAERLALSDCPWCGGEAKKEFPPLNMALKTDRPGREPLYALSAPEHAPIDTRLGDQVRINHHTDTSKCCSGSVLTKTSDRFANRRRV